MRKLIAVVSMLALTTTLSLPLSAAPQNYAKKLKKAQTIEVTFKNSYHGQQSPGEVVMKISGDQVSIGRKAPAGDQQARPMRYPTTDTYIDYAALKYYNVAQLNETRRVNTAVDFKLDGDFKYEGDTVLLGLKCKKVSTSVRSNRIDIWYTNDLPFRGNPQPNMGVPDGLVLHVERNGQAVQEAVDIKGVNTPTQLLPADMGESMTSPNYQYAINNANVITVNVFDQQTVCFNGAKLPDTLNDGEQYRCAGGTVILKKVKLPESAKGRDIFLEVIQYSEGDAYDRTGSVFVIPTKKAKSYLDALRDLKSVPSVKLAGEDFHSLVSTPEYDVPVELMRFFTGFGVRQYNSVVWPGQEWVDSVLYKTEVTALSEYLQGEVWIGAYVGNWDAKGHRLSVNLKYHPEGERKVTRAMPLFNTVNLIEQQGQPYPTFLEKDSLTVKFTVAEPVKNAQLYYLTTGHGGWGGGDEFNQKPNSIYLDGEKVITFVPWRDDCGTYRNNNPCSGNFSNGLSSSDLSRSNWCPGTVTNPEYIYLGDLAAGEHTITVKIPQGPREGNSQSYWCISGTLLY